MGDRHGGRGAGRGRDLLVGKASSLCGRRARGGFVLVNLTTLFKKLRAAG